MGKIEAAMLLVIMIPEVHCRSGPNYRTIRSLDTTSHLKQQKNKQSNNQTIIVVCMYYVHNIMYVANYCYFKQESYHSS